MEEYKLERTGDAPVKFTGELLVKGSSERDAGPRSRSWHEVAIFQTRGGKWIGHVWYHSGRIIGESEGHTVMVADSKEALRDQLLNYEYAHSGSYKCALSRALNHDERFVEEVE